MGEKLLPQNIEAERGVIGSIIIDPEAISLVADFLSAEDFYRDAHRTIYEVIIFLWERRQAADFITICDELERRSKLEEVGGASYITSLINHVPTSGNVEYYGHLVERSAILRRLIHAAGRIAAIAYEETDHALEASEELIYGIAKNRRVAGESVPVGTIFNDILTGVLAEGSSTGGAIVGVPTGLRAIDSMTSGLQRSDLIVVAGRPGTGKSSLAMSLARNAAITYSRGVLVFSLEMSKEQLVQRLTAFEARVNLKRLRFRQLNEEEKVRVVDVSGHILDAPIYIDDTPGISLTEMRSKIRRALTKHPIDLIIVDYLQKVKATYSNGERYKDRYQEVSEVARGLKDIAREFDVPVLALAQLSRAVEARSDKIPVMSDLRESGEIEQEADVVMLMYRDDYYAGYNEDGSSKSNRPGTVDLIFAKQRNDAVGEVRVGFDATQTRFYNLPEARSPFDARPVNSFDMRWDREEDNDGDE